MKKKIAVLASSVTAIALCSSVIAGTTFALFTSETKLDVTVSSANLEINSEVKNVELYSPKAIDRDGNIVDDTNVATANAFYGGGTAAFANKQLAISNMAPGDKVTFDIEVTNTNTIKALYNLKFGMVEDGGLLNALKVGISGCVEETTNFVSYTSAWLPLEASQTANVATYTVSVELPATTEGYRNKSCSFAFTAEAVQGNTAVEGEETLVVAGNTISTIEEWNALSPQMGLGGSYALLNDLSGVTMPYFRNGDDVELDLNGHTITTSSRVYACDNNDGVTVEIKNGNYIFTGTSGAILAYYKGKAVLNGVNLTSSVTAVWAGFRSGNTTILSGSIEIKNSTINTSNNGVYVVKDSKVDVVNSKINAGNCGIVLEQSTCLGTVVNVEGCEIYGANYALSTNAAESSKDVVITAKDSKFEGTASCGVMINVCQLFVADNCTFKGVGWGLFLRAGTANISNSKFEVTTDAYKYGIYSSWGMDEKEHEYYSISGAVKKYTSEVEAVLDMNWITGAGSPYAALILGNRKGNYPYNTECNLVNCEVIASGGVEHIMPVIVADTATYTTTFTYDAACSFHWTNVAEGVDASAWNPIINLCTNAGSSIAQI